MVIKETMLTVKARVEQRLAGNKKPTADTRIIFDNEIYYNIFNGVEIEPTAAGGIVVNYSDEDEFGNEFGVSIEITKQDIANLQALTK